MNGPMVLGSRRSFSTLRREEDMSAGGAAQIREEARKGYFDRFAQRSAELVSKAPFFAFCALLVVAWAPSYLWVGNLDT